MEVYFICISNPSFTLLYADWSGCEVENHTFMHISLGNLFQESANSNFSRFREKSAFLIFQPNSFHIFHMNRDSIVCKRASGAGDASTIICIHVSIMGRI